MARRWKTAEGPSYEPVKRDEVALERLGGVLSDADALLRGSTP